MEEINYLKADRLGGGGWKLDSDINDESLIKLSQQKRGQKYFLNYFSEI